MLLKKRFAFLLFFQFSVCFAGPSIQLQQPELETLPNGLKIAWFISDSLPVIDFTISVRAGFRDDPAGKSGTAELLTASIDRGSQGKTALDIAHAVEVLGGSHSANSDDDSISVGVHGLSTDADELLGILGKIVVHPDFPEAEVKREHARLMDRWSHIEDYSEVLGALAYRKAITSGTSYGRGSLATVKEFKNVTRDDVVGFYKKYFTPKNSMLLVIGRVDKIKFKQKLLTAFGEWQGDEPKRTWKNYSDPLFSKLDHKKQQIIVVHKPDLSQAQVRIGFRVPVMQAPEHYPLLVANALLGEQFESRLNSLIRDKLGLTYGIRSGFTYAKDYSDLTITVATRNDAVGQVVRKTLDVLKSMKNDTISDAEVESAKTYLEGGFPVSNSTLHSVASRWLTGYVFGLDSNYLNEFIPKIHELKTSDVQTVVKRTFDLDHSIVVIAGDAKEIKKSLENAKLVPTKQVLASDLR